MIDNLKTAFEQHANEYLNFNQILSPKPHRRPDMCAFHLLDCLMPSLDNLIKDASSEAIWFSIDCDKLTKIITHEHVIYLRRCGVFYDEFTNRLAMFL